MDEEVTPEEIEEMINMCSINGNVLGDGKWFDIYFNVFKSNSLFGNKINWVFNATVIMDISMRKFNVIYYSFLAIHD